MTKGVIGGGKSTGPAREIDADGRCIQNVHSRSMQLDMHRLMRLPSLNTLTKEIVGNIIVVRWHFSACAPETYTAGRLLPNPDSVPSHLTRRLDSTVNDPCTDKFCRGSPGGA